LIACDNIHFSEHDRVVFVIPIEIILTPSKVIHNTFTPFMPPERTVPMALIKELYQMYSSKEGYQLYPDVRDFFAELQKYNRYGPTQKLKWPYKRVVVGIITNSDDRTRKILRSFDLNVAKRRFGTSAQWDPEPSSSKDIEFVVQSYDVGHEKPDHRMFDAATAMLEEVLLAEHSETTSDTFEKLYVGDDLEKDFDGARTAGWHAVLVDRNGVMSSSPKFRYGRVNLIDRKPQVEVIMAKSLFHLGMWEPRKLGEVPRWWKYETA
jgi:FMN phosphatase YigB (HAD superfamily)